ncbi:MAG: DUF1295 domain-containing protein, partial [Pseudomonadota bacterium]
MNPHLAKNKRFGKLTSLTFVLIAYVIALAAAIVSFPFFKQMGLGDIGAVFAADMVGTVVIWLSGLPFSNASFYDPYWSVAPVPIAIYWWWLGGYDMSIRDVLFMIVLMAWANRLTTNWIRDWPGLVHEDWRYQDLRRQNGALYQLVNLGGICSFPTLLVFLGMLPAYVVLAKDNPSNLTVDIIAFAAGMFAVILQFWSDEEMRAFRKRPKGGEEVMTDGWWAWSRHPNYFGEVLMWVSLFIFALSAGGVAYAWTGIGALAMFLLFWFISIPMMDNRSAAKRPAYAEHMKHSSR